MQNKFTSAENFNKGNENNKRCSLLALFNVIMKQIGQQETSNEAED